MPFTAQTRMSGVDIDGRSIRKGAADSVRRWVEEQGGDVPDELDADRRRHRERAAARRSPSPTATRVLGVIHLKDVVKEGIAERFDRAARAWASAR